MNTKVKQIFKSGDIFIWFTGMGLGISLIMISGLLVLILVNGKNYFWPSELVELTRTDGRKQMGEIIAREPVPLTNLPDSLKDAEINRIQLKIGSRDLYGFDFIWLDEREISSTSTPSYAVAIERFEFGNFYGYIKQILVEGEVQIQGEKEVYQNLERYLDYVSGVKSEIQSVEKSEIGKLNYEIEKLRLEIKKIEYYIKDPKESELQTYEIQKEIDLLNNNYTYLRAKVDSLNGLILRYSIYCTDVSGTSRTLPLASVVRVYHPNLMSFDEQILFLFAKVGEFVFDEPRESNTEGGVFPAIFGTVMMVLLMSIAVVPFGVLAALYIREYAKQGPLVRLVRIAVNNLAGVPSIVFGVFGLGFFIYFVGGTIDELFYPERLPNPTWGTGGILWASLTLSLLTMPVVIVATEEALATIPRGVREAALALGSTKWQVIRRVVLPAATPGILTGLILAMARAAGEVAPLMITGVVKLAPSLPFDTIFPFFHLDRKFMHLGFHIYDVGFQSPNVEAAMPMVYTTTLLLILIVILLNITAMVIRAKLRRKYKTATF